MGTLVSPDKCLQNDANKVGEKCKFSCKAGFKMPNVVSDTLTCLTNGNWDAQLISCESKEHTLLIPLILYTYYKMSL